MRNMILSNKLTSGNSWSEELHPDAHEQSSQTYGYDFGQRILNIKINFLDIAQAISYIVGYSQSTSTVTKLPYNPQTNQTQSPYKLNRFTPARHPAMPNLRATKILWARGAYLRNNIPVGLPTSGAQRVGPGVYGQYDLMYLSIIFEIPRYPILTDQELGTNPEYRRYAEWMPEVNLETTTRKGQTWYFCDTTLNQTTFPGERFIRQPKTLQKIMWYDVHQDYVMLGRTTPSNFEHRIGTVNATPFPLKGWLDQNVNPLTNVNQWDGTQGPPYVQRYPGTCLLLAPKITYHAQCHPAVVAGMIDSGYFPRTVDVEINILVFDPPTDEDTTIDLSGNDQFGFPMNGYDATIIAGHNLVPLVQPVFRGGRWYSYFAVTTGSNIQTVITGAPYNGGAGYVWNQLLVNLINLIKAGATTAIINGAAITYLRSTYGFGNPAPVTLVAAVNQALTASIGDPGFPTGAPINYFQTLYPYSDFETLFLPCESLEP